MRVVFCYPYITGYMAACWRALAARGEVQLSIVALRSDVPGVDWKFDDAAVARGLDIRLLSPQEHADEALVRNLVESHKPQIVVIPGWAHASYRNLVTAPGLVAAGTKYVMTMDTPWRGTWRQRLARYKLSSFLKHIDRIVVPGERAFQFARILGMPDERIHRGLYGVDYAAFAPLREQRLAQSSGVWPRMFLYMGRYQHEKGLDFLLESYRTYRAAVSDPWGLTCCGTGPLEGAMSAEAGVKNKGFVQPWDQPPIIARSGVLVLPSRFEPWGLAIAEAFASGIPVIHTEACGAGVELVRQWYNGIIVPTENVRAMAGAMRWCHQNIEQLPEMGARGQPFAAAYSAEAWVVRWSKMFEELLGAG